MNADDSKSVKSVRKDLEELLRDGIKTSSLEMRSQLVIAVGRVAEVPESLSTQHRAELLRGIFENIAQDAFEHVRKEVLEGRGARKDNPERLLLAAVELLELGSAKWDDAFQAAGIDLIKERRDPYVARSGQDAQSVWLDICQQKDNRGKARRFFRAAVWTGNTSAQSGRRLLKGEALLDSLDTAFLSYLETQDFQTYFEQWKQALPQSSMTAEPPATVASKDDQLSELRQKRVLVNRRQSISRTLRNELQDFAEQVLRQMEGEQKANRVLDPLPITLTWSGSEEHHLVAHPDTIDEYFRDVDELLTLDSIVERLLKAKSGRLILLGEAGSGKSTLVAELAVQFLQARTANDPVPVIFNLASWQPSASLESWMEDRLIQTYRNLGRRKKHNGRKASLASLLVESGGLLPIFDGLDEIAKQVRSQAIPAINAYLGRHTKSVLTSWPQEYKDAVTDDGGALLHGAQVLVIDPLTIDIVAEYMKRSIKPLVGVGGERSTKWSPVISFMQDRTETRHCRMLLEVFSTPFMVMLARATYDNSSADPIELLDKKRFRSTSSVHAHLLDAFIPSRYTESVSRALQLRGVVREAPSAQRYLGFLAHNISLQGSAQFNWWEPGTRALDKVSRFGVVAVGLISIAAQLHIKGYSDDAISTGASYLASLNYMLIIAALIALLGFKETRDKIREAGNGKIRALGRTLNVTPYVFVLSLGFLVYGAGTRNLYLNILVITGAFLAFWPLAIESRLRADMKILNAKKILQFDRRAIGVRLLLLYATAAAIYLLTLLVGFEMEWGYFLGTLLVCSVLMPATSISGGLVFYCVAMFSRRRLPLRLMRFLEDAHRRGILRQSGGAYQFRHRLLQEHLASKYEEEAKRL